MSDEAVQEEALDEVRQDIMVLFRAKKEDVPRVFNAFVAKYAQLILFRDELEKGLLQLQYYIHPDNRRAKESLAMVLKAVREVTRQEVA